MRHATGRQQLAGPAICAEGLVLWKMLYILHMNIDDTYADVRIVNTLMIYIYIYIDMAQCLVPPSPRHGDGPYMHMNVYKIIIDYTGMCVSICT